MQNPTIVTRPQSGFISVLLAVIMSIGLSISGYLLYISYSEQEELTSKLEHTKRKLRVNERALRDSQSLSEQQERQLSQLSYQRKRLNNEIISIEQQLNDLQKLNDSSQTALKKNIEAKYTSVQAELNTERERNQAYSATIETLEQRLKKEQVALTELKKELVNLDKKNTQLSSEKNGLIKKLNNGTTIIRLDNAILFPSGSATLNARGKATLALVAEALAAFPKHRISVEGHTDHRPIISSLSQQYPTNWELSAARASFAIRYLTDQGLPPNQFQAVAYGSTRPLVKKGDLTQNRRIEILLYPPNENITVDALAIPIKRNLSSR